MKQKGINLNILSIALFAVMGIILFLFGIQIHRASLSVQEQIQIEENRRLCELESHTLADASDYLTSEVWHFVATQDVTRMENYWNEVRNARNRDRAMERLTSLSLTGEELLLMENAKRASDSLIGGETWAMRLVADSIDMTPGEMPPEMAAVRYTQGEDSLSGQEKLAMASRYIFGEEYTQVKEIIRSNIDSFRQLLSQRKSRELKTAVYRNKSSLSFSRVTMLALVLVFALAAALYYSLVVRPFHFYARSLRKMDREGYALLTPMGSRETVSFAKAFNDIYSEWSKQKSRLEQERYRFHMALQNAPGIVYEYDLAADTYTAFGTLEGADGPAFQPPPERVIPRFLESYSGEMLGRSGMDLLSGILSGRDCSPVELKVRPYIHYDRELWVRVTGTPVFDESHGLVRLIGRISNIQSEKDKEFALEDARNRDGLTGLYKREAGVRKAWDYMEKKSPSEICCIMLLDMDGFTQLNETEGPVFADAVLQDVAHILVDKTGPDDIRIRLGGDEFMLFIKNCPKSRATVLGPEIARAIGELSVRQTPGPQISASIGMCVTEVVDEYSGLYRCAESTLKYVKENGKNRAACYLDTSNELGMLLTQMYPDRHKINAIDRPESAKEDLTSFALDLLGKSKNLDDAIFLLLARVGNVCRLDRVLICDVDSEYLSCSIAYQWSKDPSDRWPAEPFYITRGELVALSRSYGTDGLCDRHILSTPCGMESALHAGIWNYGACAGFMAFEVKASHTWTGQERSLLGELTKIISSFTLKARADAVSRAKTDFLSRISHEIRTPMNAITGMTTIARSFLDSPGKMTDCLNKIESANKYLLSLINDVLDMSRIESGKVEINPERTFLAELTANIETLIRPQAEDKGLIFQIANDFPQDRPVTADALRLTQVLVNLLGNAVKFTGEDGRVSLEIKTLKTDGQAALLRFTVSDTGIGINDEARGRIFNAFEQAGAGTASAYGGTGLGLAISSRLVQLMGGVLKVESEPGKGSVFSFTLRLPFDTDTAGQALESGAGEADRPAASPDPSPGVPSDPVGRRLLLAEDNAMNQEIAQEILSMHGFAVETASDGREALELFERRGPGYYDAILMDIRMPVMDGMEATRRIRTLGKSDSRTVPIIAMTANAFDEDMKKSLENGMDGHLSKPIDVDALLSTLDRLISAKNENS